MITLLGALFLFFSFPVNPTPWLEKADTLLPWAFLFGLFMSFALLTVKSVVQPTFKSVSWHERGLTIGLPFAFLGLLMTFLPHTELHKEVAVIAYILFFVWIDATFVDIFLLRRRFSFNGAAKLLSSRLRRAVHSRDLHATLSEFESISLLCEEVFSLPNTPETREGAQLFLSSIEQILAHIPQINLPKDEKETETLLDTYFVFQAIVAKKLETFIIDIKGAPSDQKWDLLIKMLSKVTSLFLSLNESFSVPFLSLTEDLAIYLQEQKSSKEVELYAGSVEAIKAILEFASLKRRDACTYAGPVLHKLESLMKERFRRDRTINPAYLMQPFAEIATFLTHPSFTALPGKEELMSDLKRILSQFAVLETISGRMGETHATDTAATYQQDIPYIKQKQQEEQ